jgi:hypothetical protein
VARDLEIAWRLTMEDVPDSAPMSEPLDEERVPTLVDDDSALGLARLGLGSAACGALVAIGIPAARFLLPQSAWEPVMVVIFLVVLVFRACGLWAFHALAAAMARERDAGYTSLHGRYWELWQLDPKTGEVLRRPGEREVRRRPRTPV